MTCISPWGQAQGGRAVVKTVLTPTIKRALRESVPRDVGFVLLRDMGFGVTIQNSNFGVGGGGGLFPGGSIGGGGSSTLVFFDRPVGTESLGILEFWKLGI